MSTEAEWAWAAGLFEGEGSIIVKRQGRRKVLALSLKMTDEDVVRRLHGIVGGVVFGPYQYQQDDGSERKPWWLWRNDGVDPSRVIRQMWPWLGARRRAKAEELGVLSQLTMGLETWPGSPHDVTQ